MKKWILFCCFLVAILCCSASATTIGIIVKDLASRGGDQYLGDYAHVYLGYDTVWIDGDDIHTTAWWNSTADVYVSTERDYNTGYAWPQLDSLGKSTSAWLALGYMQGDEINLGLGYNTAGTTPRIGSNMGYALNVAPTDTIMKIFQDTIGLWAGTQIYFGLLFPDTCHQVKVLLLDRIHRTDSSIVTMAIANEGDTIINTGDGNFIVQGKRAYCALFRESGIPDTCQWWTLYLRTVAWLVNDLDSDSLLSWVCFSGTREIEDNGPLERSHFPDSIQTFGQRSNGDFYLGQDSDEKSTIIKLSKEAILRKLQRQYRSFTLDQFYMRLKLKGKEWDITDPTTYATSWTLNPLKLSWECGIGNGETTSVTSPWASWTYRYVDTAATPDVWYAWNQGGAQEDGTDRYPYDGDSITVTQATAIGSYVNVGLYIDADSSDDWLLDTALANGWVTDVLYASHSGPGMEIVYYSVDIGTIADKPIIVMHMDSFSTSVPSPTIDIEDAYGTDMDSLVFTGTVGGSSPIPQYAVIKNSVTGEMSYVLTVADSSWISLWDPMNGAAPGWVRNTINITGLSAGYYSDVVTVTAVDATNSPQTYKVVLTVNSPVTSATATSMVGVRKP